MADSEDAVVQFKVDAGGTTRIKAQLEKLKRKASKAQIEKALVAGGEIILAAMQERVPERTPAVSGTALPPGALAADLRVAKIGGLGNKPATVVVGPGTDTEHVAGWVEWGHREVKGGYSKLLPNDKTRGPGLSNEVVPAHPFLRPAWEASHQEAFARVVEVLREEVE